MDIKTHYFSKELTLTNFNINFILHDIDIFLKFIDKYLSSEETLDLFEIKGIISFEELLDIKNSYEEYIYLVNLNLVKLFDIIYYIDPQAIRLEGIYMNNIIINFNQLNKDMSSFKKYL